ncbi:hypothetical protein KEM55_000791 [Ascosphaera atra]|nr:hypothetical protein KEM55_000791 [Ascosphaera atra]
MPIGKVLFWSGFGVATRMWQLGIEQRSILEKGSLWVYGLFGGIGGSFGYWLQGVEDRQLSILSQRKDLLLAKRARRAEREAQEASA